MRPYYFEKLDVWQKGRELVKVVYRISDQFPGDEKFGLVSQIRRAAVSVIANLAEGSSRTSSKDQARFTEISYGSLMETLNLLIVAVDLNFIKENQLHEIRPLIEEIGNKLHALRQSQLKCSNNQITIK